MRILLDVDGVLADFTGEVLRLANEVCGAYRDNWRDKTVDDVTCFDIRKALGLNSEEWDLVGSQIGARGFARRLDAYPGAAEGIKALAADHAVHFVTAQWWSSPTWCHDRTEWLCRHFGQRQGRSVTFTHEKHRLMGDVLIEDKPGTLEDWLRYNPNGLALLWDRPWNRECDLPEIVRVSSWDEVHVAVRGMA